MHTSCGTSRTLIFRMSYIFVEKGDFWICSPLYLICTLYSPGSLGKKSKWMHRLGISLIMLTETTWLFPSVRRDSFSLIHIYHSSLFRYTLNFGNNHITLRLHIVNGKLCLLIDRWKVECWPGDNRLISGRKNIHYERTICRREKGELFYMGASIFSLLTIHRNIIECNRDNMVLWLARRKRDAKFCPSHWLNLRWHVLFIW